MSFRTDFKSIFKSEFMPPTLKVILNTIYLQKIFLQLNATFNVSCNNIQLIESCINQWLRNLCINVNCNNIQLIESFINQWLLKVCISDLTDISVAQMYANSP